MKPKQLQVSPTSASAVDEGNLESVVSRLKALSHRADRVVMTLHTIRGLLTGTGESSDTESQKLTSGSVFSEISELEYTFTEIESLLGDIQ